MFKILQQLSLAGESKNIDLLRTSDNCILLMDGSTPLVKSDYDASLFVTDFADAFFEQVENGTNIPTSVKIALDKVHMLFKAKVNADSVYTYPSACFLAAYMDGNKFKIMNIGDSTALAVMKNGEVRVFTCNDVPRLDAKVIERAKEIREAKGLNICDAMKLPEIKEMLIENRKKMNSPDGYKILTFTMPEVGNEDIPSFDPDDIDRIILYTDGFDGCADMLADTNADLDVIYKTLRNRENNDATLNKYPRLKVSDDASAIIFKIV